MKQNWFERLVNSLGGSREDAKRAGASKHERGKRKPRGWHIALRRKRRCQKAEAHSAAARVYENAIQARAVLPQPRP